MQLKIKHRSTPEWLICALFVMQFIVPGLIQLLKIPSFVKYLFDLIWLLLLIFILSKKNLASNKDFVFFGKWIGVFLLITLLGYLINYQSFFFYFWGLRNNFRFYVVFLASILFLREIDKKLFFKLIDIFFWINALVCFIQYFIFDINQDYLGGLFGVEQGCNGAMNIFLCIAVAKTVLLLMRSKTNYLYSILLCGVSLVIAAFSELKFFYLEFIVIIIASSLMTKMSIKKVLFILFAIAGIIVGINILIKIFPVFKDFFTIEGIFSNITDENGYTGIGDMGRFTGFNIISNNFLRSFRLKLFGLGLGNCDYSSAFDFFNTSFFNRFGELHYTWVSTLWMYLECGIIGLAMFLGFFVSVIVKALKKIKNTPVQNIQYCQYTVLLGLIGIMCAFYNSSLRIESAYLLYILMALPFCKINIPNVLLKETK